MAESAEASEKSSHLSAALERGLSFVFIVVLILCIAATVGVLFSGMPPLFNQKASVYQLANVICLVCLVALTAALIVTSLVKKLHPARRVLVLILVSLSTIEALLYVFDTQFISAKGSPMQWAFRNVWIHGDPVWLPQPTSDSTFGFRNPAPNAAEQPTYHVLFLGNSFVSGSGTGFATNYPQVVWEGLKLSMPERKIEVMSAGVDGFGPKEDRLIYEYLLEQGYKFDLVVVNFNLGSDPTNDVPGTFRQSVAGQAQRFPENKFLKLFYPVDTNLFRYGYYFEVTFNPRFGSGDDSSGPGDANCKTTSNFINYATERTWLYYGPGADKRVYLDYNLADIFKIADVAKSHEARVAVVLLPDRFAVLSNPAGAADSSLDRAWTRHHLVDKLGTRVPIFDLTPYFVDRPEFFACNDLHWNDAGNVEGGRRVSAYLTKFLRSD